MRTPNGDEPAFPFACQGPTTGPEFYYGLTKREEIAKCAMSAILSNSSMVDNDTATVIKRAAVAAVNFADALLAELENKQ